MTVLETILHNSLMHETNKKHTYLSYIKYTYKIYKIINNKTFKINGASNDLFI